VTAAPNVDRALAHGILRLTLGVNICLHGFQRLANVHGFVAGTVRSFAGFLPGSLVAPYATILPYAETLLGALLVLGLFQRPVLVLGALLMASLTFGTALLSEYAALAQQLAYELAYFVLLATRDWDVFSLDALIARRLGPPATRW